MAIMHHVVDEALDKVFERPQLQLKAILAILYKVKVGTTSMCQVKGGSTATTGTSMGGECHGDGYREYCQEEKL